MHRTSTRVPRPTLPWRAAAALAMLTLVWPLARGFGAQEASELSRLIARSGAYVEGFVSTFTSIVAEEHYVQTASIRTRVGSTNVTRREIKADFLLVKLGGASDWVPFRDAFEVDGAAIRERSDRLTKLFLSDSADVGQQAARIAAESARFNVGFSPRVTNSPLVALGFLQGVDRPRFEFTAGGRASESGVTLRIVNYRERARPTLFRGERDRDLAARGRFWIDVETGAVHRTELRLDAPPVFTTITTEFARQPGFDILLPLSMREEQRHPNGNATVGIATYSRFRRFAVVSDEAVGSPPQ